jgi:hypothetical protein
VTLNVQKRRVEVNVKWCQLSGGSSTTAALDHKCCRAFN